MTPSRSSPHPILLPLLSHLSKPTPEYLNIRPVSTCRAKKRRWFKSSSPALQSSQLSVQRLHPFTSWAASEANP
ncbi:hypothetical protein EVAR_81100_1 [Eumeta japonica]|uniref:Uncharacterized protein n=1 Tax=Eumeta variegata TaxID=151549 RepID=A0A4C1T5Z6_EUMVA|nr:hypothetical protein EVAR_81100_1 [Eumeta japonica]